MISDGFGDFGFEIIGVKFVGIDSVLAARPYLLHIKRLAQSSITDIANVGVVIGVNQDIHTHHPNNIFSSASCSTSTDDKLDRLVFQRVVVLEVIKVLALVDKFNVLGAFINQEIITTTVKTLFNN